MSDEKWSWWVGHDDERFHTRCESRDEAVEIAEEQFGGGYIVEALDRENIALSGYFDIEEFVERAEEAASEDHGDPEGDCVIFDISLDVLRDLEHRVKRIIDEWQNQHGITFRSFWFRATRNGEYIAEKGQYADCAPTPPTPEDTPPPDRET